MICELFILDNRESNFCRPSIYWSTDITKVLKIYHVESLSTTVKKNIVRPSKHN
jgi:hypothetical protein